MTKPKFGQERTDSKQQTMTRFAVILSFHQPETNCSKLFVKMFKEDLRFIWSAVHITQSNTTKHNTTQYVRHLIFPHRLHPKVWHSQVWEVLARRQSSNQTLAKTYDAHRCMWMISRTGFLEICYMHNI